MNPKGVAMPWSSDEIIFSENSIPDKALLPNDIIGRKACGLLSIPRAWRLPFFVIKTEAYQQWLAAASEKERNKLLAEASQAIFDLVKTWTASWPRGIIIRSSAVNETLHDRGTYDSHPLPADYNLLTIAEAVAAIFSHFLKNAKKEESIALIIQPLISQKYLGHLSNEVRVSDSPTKWEYSFGSTMERFDSRRDPAPNSSKILNTKFKEILGRLKSLGNWATSLNRGRVHIEWLWDDDKNIIWLLQIDFEDEAPDIGKDPRNFLREADTEPCGRIPKKSIIRRATFKKDTGWKKVDAVRTFLSVDVTPYPELFLINGQSLEIALRTKRAKQKLQNDIAAISNGRAVCRTDYKGGLPKDKVNLPRTDSVSPEKALLFLEKTFKLLIQKGAKAKDICFILHKFIPARASAWAMASPDNQIVIIDSLWGVPDGLAYYPHDSFQVDAKLRKIVSERPRYKPFYIQESKNGSWNQIQVNRKVARSRSLLKKDLLEISKTTYNLAKAKNTKILVMWFCGIPETVKTPRNLPWFIMEPEANAPSTAAPHIPHISIRNKADIEKASTIASKHGLLLEPDIPFVRDNNFLDKITALALQKDWPVIVQGSTLAHAYYKLQANNVTVYPSDVPKYTRPRNRQVFKKLVRDDIPARIEALGEKVVLAKIPKSEARPALLAKLFEEAIELKNAKAPDAVLEEIADLLEVIKSISSATGIRWEEVQAAAENKRKERGSFIDGVVLMETSWHSANEEAAPAKSNLISLSALEQIKHTVSGTEINYPSLLNSNNGQETTLPSGQKIRVRITTNGLIIEEVKPLDLSSSEQLELKFDES